MIQARSGIQTKGIIKDFPTGDEITRVLFGIDITIHPGMMTMLVGPSGSGKTTFLSIIAGILTPTAGEIYVNGQELSKFSDNHKVLFRRKHIGFIFQQFNLIPTLTIAENVAIPLVAKGNISLEDAIKKAVDMLSQLEMAQNARKLPKQLSGGQQQRVAIARALIHKPDVIICDEPTAALDAHTGQTVMNILRDNALKPESTVLVVTHDSRIFHFADRIIHLSDGKIEKDEPQKGTLS
jgi:putative ABC transport system ATP-binding protein